MPTTLPQAWQTPPEHGLITHWTQVWPAGQGLLAVHPTPALSWQIAAGSGRVPKKLQPGSSHRQLALAPHWVASS